MTSVPARSRPRRLLTLLLVLSLLANGALAWRLFRPGETPEASAPPPELRPYAALGSAFAENNRLRDLDWTDPQFNAFLDGLRAHRDGRGYPVDEDAERLRDAINARVQAMLAAEQPDPTEQYFRTLRDRENVQRTASNLHYRITLEGEGTPPAPDDAVVVSYAARTPDGQTIQALTGVRVRVLVTDLMPGLAEGVQLLKPGGKALVYVPAELSFSEGNWPPEVPPGMPLGFFVELHEVVKPAAGVDTGSR